MFLLAGLALALLLRHPDSGTQVVGLLALVVLGLGITTATLRGCSRGRPS